MSRFNEVQIDGEPVYIVDASRLGEINCTSTIVSVTSGNTRIVDVERVSRDHIFSNTTHFVSSCSSVIPERTMRVEITKNQ